ncbi:coiled-coil domain-containing protein 15 [Kryptolebias marmoratus]|uniref:Coiled-coil domain containing 15 n=1 Tax=Kryptolebias marmoratus TaxID=37003 RepID=A0A3Q3B8V3_KRYMA|nr:coiled-coil domain-containing protein 15 [Kryptolebias marmoratus]
MNASRVKGSAARGSEAKAGPTKEHRASRTSRVLAERNQAVVAVGAWVEDGQDFSEHPSDLALLTEELQAEKRRENEESLRRFQDDVRRRLARQARVGEERWQPRTHPKLTPDRRIPHYQVWTHRVSLGEDAAAQQRRSSPQSVEAMRQVRLRLAACRLIPQDEPSSELPGGRWNVSPSRHGNKFDLLRPGEDVLEEEGQEKADVPFFISHHECPLVQQKAGGRAPWDPEKSHPDPGSKSAFNVPQVLWPLTDHEEVKKQRQSQFLLQRRRAMTSERERVKENKLLRKHLKRTASIKAEREKVRLEEETRLERARQLGDIRRRLEERELLILERLKLEEEERQTTARLQRRKREEKEKDAARFVEALRAQLKERLSQLKLEPPPLCCCASSFWDSHPDTCANNCIFHNNPKEYSKALHSTVASLDLQ